MSDQAGEKKHPASENKLRNLRKGGEWYSSRELTSAALMGTLALLWSAALPVFTDRTVALAKSAWQPERLASPDPFHALGETARQTAEITALMVIVVLGAMFCVVAVVQFLQVGAMFSVKPLWRPEVLNPAAGFRKIFFRPETWRKAALGLVKAALMLGLVVVSISSGVRNLVLSVRLGPLSTVHLFQGTVTAFLWEAAALYALFGAVDYLIERKGFEARNKMTDEELRKDTKETEGSMESKIRLRQLQRLRAGGAGRPAAPEEPRRAAGWLGKWLRGNEEPR